MRGAPHRRGQSGPRVRPLPPGRSMGPATHVRSWPMTVTLPDRSQVGNIWWLPMVPADTERRLRSICLAYPGVTEKSSHGAPAFFAGRQFLAIWLDGHHDHRFPHLWCAAPPGVQDELVTSEPDRFFRPPYVGGRGWLGVRLDGTIDWSEIEHICEEAFRSVAPRKLVRALDDSRA
jgi:hypothetical protein